MKRALNSDVRFPSNPSSHRQNLHIGVSLFTCPCTCPFPYAPSRSRPAATPSLSTRLISMWGETMPNPSKVGSDQFQSLSQACQASFVFDVKSESQSLSFFCPASRILFTLFAYNCVCFPSKLWVCAPSVCGCKLMAAYLSQC